MDIQRVNKTIYHIKTSELKSFFVKYLMEEKDILIEEKDITNIGATRLFAEYELTVTVEGQANEKG